MLDLCTMFEDLIIHAVIRPKVTIMIGIILITGVVIIDSWFEAVNHSIADPEVIDINVRTIIGMVSDFDSSR